ncbi:MAG: Holliday junction branch migration protein RuvA [Dehalococcoidia bacterium]|nr:Holliday junction branch migration protein RuvA [Dehalococcoidia bacterium]MDW8120107.1 Holliday junction branch migration protein RuvA [Chloroflexota bacterium]
MIRAVRGKLEAIGQDTVVVQVGPVSLEVGVPASVIPTLGPVGSVVCLYTTLFVRDERPVLFGFPTEEGRRLFELLLTVNGIGPRLGMALLGHLSPQEISRAIIRGDVDALAQAPGVGRKTASRIVLELRERLAKSLSPVPVDLSDQQDLVSALLALGYSRAEAQEALRAVPQSPALPLEERLRRALEHLAHKTSS